MASISISASSKALSMILVCVRSSSVHHHSTSSSSKTVSIVVVNSPGSWCQSPCCKDVLPDVLTSTGASETSLSIGTVRASIILTIARIFILSASRVPISTLIVTVSFLTRIGMNQDD